MELLIPVTVAVAALLVVVRISFVHPSERDRVACNSDLQRPVA